MIWVAAVLGLFLLLAFGRWRAAAFRWLRRAVCATVGLSAWLYFGRSGHYPVLGYLAYTFPFVAAAWIFRRRLSAWLRAHLPWTDSLRAWLPERVPSIARRRIERAFKDEVGDDGKPSVPRLTRYERVG